MPIKDGIVGALIVGGGDGGNQPVTSDTIWRPDVDEAGNISWARSDDPNPPETVNIKGPAGTGVPEITTGDEGKVLGVNDGQAVWVPGGTGSGNVSSPNVNTIRVMDQQEYADLVTKDPNTIYFLRG